MDLTESYESAFPHDVLARFHWAEVRNAAAVIAHTNPHEFNDLIDVLQQFRVDPALDIESGGGNESETAARLNRVFRDRGWREGDYKVTLSAALKVLPWAAAGETAPTVTNSDSGSTSYLIDNLKRRVALDVEWHAKDGNLDRDLAAYRALYDSAIIDGAVMITMYRAEMRRWAIELLGPESKKFGTSTTTNLEKVRPRLERGDGGGCPILIVAIGRQTV